MKWKSLLLLVTFVLSGARSFAGEPGDTAARHITLREAVQLAIKSCANTLKSKATRKRHSGCTSARSTFAMTSPSS